MAFEPSRLASFDRDTLLAEIKRVLRQLGAGRAPSHKEFNRISRVHSATIAKEFGTWETAMRTAGADYARSRIATSDLEGDLRRVLEASGGKYFTQQFYAQAGGKYSRTTLKKRLRCANWAGLLEKVLKVRPAPRVILKRVRVRRPLERKRTQCTPESLLSELRSTAAKSDSKAFSHAEYRALGGRYSIGTFQKHIGRWRYAVSLIGRDAGHVHPRPHLKFTNEDYFAEMQRVWEMLGRQPKSGEMKPCGSKMSPQAFQTRFGSWMRAVHAFCEDRRSAEDCPKSPPTVWTGELGIPARPRSSVAHEESKEHVMEGLLVIHKTTPRAPSLRLRFKVFQRDRFTCRACGRSPAIESGVVLHVDHVIPYSGRGETILDNLQTLCGKCNLGKSNSIPIPG